MQPYDYAHRQGVTPISWEEFGALAARLAELIQPAGIELVLGVARAGLFPATAVACALRRDLFPVRLSRRVADEVRFRTPVWHTLVPEAVVGRSVVVIDEIADTGETLALVAARARDLGAARVLTATLVSHTWANPMPDACALVSDALVLFPWDRQVLIDGRWRPHPELADALRAQGLDGEGSATIPP